MIRGLALAADGGWQLLRQLQQSGCLQEFDQFDQFDQCPHKGL
jgi:hypothetical protein